MGITFEIEKPELLPELITCLTSNGCVTTEIDDRLCRVDYPEASDAVEEWLEVRFFLRAWQARNGGVEITLRREPAPNASV